EAFERSRRHRKSVEMLFAHLKRIFRLGRLRLRGPCGAQDEFTLAAIAQNLRRLAKLVARPPPPADPCLAYPMSGVSAPASALHKERMVRTVPRTRGGQPRCYNRGLLQQNRHKADMPTPLCFVRFEG